MPSLFLPLYIPTSPGPREPCPASEARGVGASREQQGTVGTAVVSDAARSNPSPNPEPLQTTLGLCGDNHRALANEYTRAVGRGRRPASRAPGGMRQMEAAGRPSLFGLASGPSQFNIAALALGVGPSQSVSIILADRLFTLLGRVEVGAALQQRAVPLPQLSARPCLRRSPAAPTAREPQRRHWTGGGRGESDIFRSSTAGFFSFLCRLAAVKEGWGDRGIGISSGRHLLPVPFLDLYAPV